MAEEIRKFETGATRDSDTTKPDFEGFISPLVIARYGEYMHKNRFQKDGKMRDADNWQKGIPFAAYMKSGWRHFFAWWGYHRGVRGDLGDGWYLEEALLGVMFNSMGYLHELLKRRKYVPALEWDKPKAAFPQEGCSAVIGQYMEEDYRIRCNECDCTRGGHSPQCSRGR